VLGSAMCATAESGKQEIPLKSGFEGQTGDRSHRSHLTIDIGSILLSLWLSLGISAVQHWCQGHILLWS
jgi:hypothetical protein